MSRFKFVPELSLGHVMILIVWLVSCTMYIMRQETKLELINQRQLYVERAVEKLSSVVETLADAQIELTTIVKKGTHKYESN